jgi:hypothetical protein
LTCDRVQVVSSGIVDIPNVAANRRGIIQICGSAKWKRLAHLLPEIFVTILSHETLHIVLRNAGRKASEDLDNVGSLSTISRSLRDIPKCSKYPHGLIGIDM